MNRYFKQRFLSAILVFSVLLTVVVPVHAGPVYNAFQRLQETGSTLKEFFGTPLNKETGDFYSLVKSLPNKFSDKPIISFLIKTPLKLYFLQYLIRDCVARAIASEFISPYMAKGSWTEYGFELGLDMFLSGELPSFAGEMYDQIIKRFLPDNVTKFEILGQRLLNGYAKDLFKLFCGKYIGCPEEWLKEKTMDYLRENDI